MNNGRDYRQAQGQDRPVARRWSRTGLLLGTLGLALAPTAALAAGDPTGGDPGSQDALRAANFSWVLMAAFLVFFMQAGFAFLGAGFIRAKNTVNYLTKSFLDFCMASLSYWAFGFALMWGGSKAASGLDDGNAIIGYSGFFLTGDAYDVDTILSWFFQMVFAATAATIVAGAVAERTKVNAYLAYSFIVGAIIYPIYGHWVWGGGWLGSLELGTGVKDFAGSGVVSRRRWIGRTGPAPGWWDHGLASSTRTARPTASAATNMMYVLMGTFILFFGWFGFNPGSTLAAGDLRIAVIATNTFLAGTTGAVAAMYITMVRSGGKVDLEMSCNGALAGLVGITAPCAYVAPWAAVVIGAIAAVVLILSLSFVERVLRVDDPVGAVSVHGANGLWGLLAVGIFADGTYGDVKGLIVGDVGQLLAQLVDVGVCSSGAWGPALSCSASSRLRWGCVRRRKRS